MLKKPDDDLFKSSTMTFGEHLEELRRALFKALIGLFIGSAIGLYFGDSVVKFINEPLEKALAEYYQTQAIAVVRRDVGSITPSQEAAIKDRGLIFEPVYIEPQALAQSLRNSFPNQHIELELPEFFLVESDVLDLRRFAVTLQQGEGPAGRVWSLLPASTQKLIDLGVERGTLTGDQVREIVQSLNAVLDRKDLYDETAFAQSNQSDLTKELFAKRESLSAGEQRELNWRLLADAYPDVIAAPHPTLVPIMIWRLVKNDDRLKPKSLGVQEPFILWIKASFITGFVIASPWVFYQIWMFVAAGLYPHERKYVFMFLPFSLLLFLFGVGLAFFFVFQPVLSYLFKFNASLGIDPDPRVGEWLSFFLTLPLGFGAAFQLPLIMLFLNRIGVVSVEMYLSKWKLAVMAITILACVLTPADPISFLFLGIPLLLLYFGGILLCMWRPRKPVTEVAPV